ncbi:PadR family transcriptional regulator [Pseudolysinimonas kribbensis]|uniref:PadR family transcriptional regulator n=1 Tax=Pseudolysinimonas kribbensis TaxID=433641 RepID=UPI0024E06571|nr:PadR family transcriptional regulator [Pseudolysinimonas kribbensis]
MPRRRPGALIPLEFRILECGLEMQTPTHGFHGFLLARALQDVSDSASLIGHGTLYKALARMAKAGLLESAWEDPASAEAEGRPRRKNYRVTPQGATALARARAEQPSPLAAPAHAARGIA